MLQTPTIRVDSQQHFIEDLLNTAQWHSFNGTVQELGPYVEQAVAIAAGAGVKAAFEFLWYAEQQVLQDRAAARKWR